MNCILPLDCACFILCKRLGKINKTWPATCLARFSESLTNLLQGVGQGRVLAHLVKTLMQYNLLPMSSRKRFDHYQTLSRAPKRKSKPHLWTGDLIDAGKAGGKLPRQELTVPSESPRARPACRLQPREGCKTSRTVDRGKCPALSRLGRASYKAP